MRKSELIAFLNEYSEEDYEVRVSSEDGLLEAHLSHGEWSDGPWLLLHPERTSARYYAAPLDVDLTPVRNTWWRRLRDRRRLRKFTDVGATDQGWRFR